MARCHSPLGHHSEFQRIYEEALEKLAGESFDQLIGLGCGTGEKEARLYRGFDAKMPITAIDVSEDLVREAARRLAEMGAKSARHLVCDLSQADFISAWLEKNVGSGRRLITFFGLVPNFAPAPLGELFSILLRPGDVLVASVHLIPAAAVDPETTASAMRALLPQYNNPETLAWLAEGLKTWRLDALTHPPAMIAGEWEGVPAFLGQATWRAKGPAAPSPPLHLFHSLRHTPGSFNAFLAREKLDGENLSLTSCGQEGIWRIQNRVDLWHIASDSFSAPAKRTTELRAHATSSSQDRCLGTI